MLATSQRKTFNSVLYKTMKNKNLLQGLAGYRPGFSPTHSLDQSTGNLLDHHRRGPVQQWGGGGGGRQRLLEPVLGIRDILLRIRIRGSEPLTNESDSFLQWLENKIFPYFFVITYPQAQYLYLISFAKILFVFCKLYFRKGKDSDPDPWGPKTYGSGSPTLPWTLVGQRLVDCCWALVSTKARRTAERGLELTLGWSLSDPPGPDPKKTIVNFLKLPVCQWKFRKLKA